MEMHRRRRHTYVQMILFVCLVCLLQKTYLSKKKFLFICLFCNPVQNTFDVVAICMHQVTHWLRADWFYLKGDRSRDYNFIKHHTILMYAKLVGSVFLIIGFRLFYVRTQQRWTAQCAGRRATICLRDNAAYVLQSERWMHICISRSMQTIFRLKLTVKRNFQIYCSDINLFNFFACYCKFCSTIINIICPVAIMRSLVGVFK